MFKADKFKVGDKVNCVISDQYGFAEWQNATVVKVDPGCRYPYSCKCEFYGDEEGLFREDELELASDE